MSLPALGPGLRLLMILLVSRIPIATETAVAVTGTAVAAPRLAAPLLPLPLLLPRRPRPAVHRLQAAQPPPTVASTRAALTRASTRAAIHVDAVATAVEAAVMVAAVMVAAVGADATSAVSRPSSDLALAQDSVLASGPGASRRRTALSPKDKHM